VWNAARIPELTKIKTIEGLCEGKKRPANEQGIEFKIVPFFVMFSNIARYEDVFLYKKKGNCTLLYK